MEYFVFNTETDADTALGLTGKLLKRERLDGKWITPYADIDETLLPEHTTEKENLSWYSPESKHYKVLSDIIKQKIENQFESISTGYAKIKRDFIQENIIMGITQQGKTQEVLDAFKDVDYAMSNYSLYAAAELVDNIVRTEPFLTDERLNSFKAKLLSLI